MAKAVLAQATQAMRRFHRNEEGDLVGGIAMGAVGVLLASVVLSVMSDAIQGSGSGSLKSMFTSLLGGGKGKLSSFL